MPHVTLFLCGVISGAVTVLFTLWFAFLKAEDVLNRTVKRKEAAAMQLLQTMPAKNTLPSSEVEVVCQIARFDNRIIRRTIPVRAVLSDRKITVYHTHGEGNTDGLTNSVARGELLIGTISLDSVESSLEKVSRYHRHTDTAERRAPVRGSCLVLSRRARCPLFIPSQTAVATTLRQEQEIQRGGLGCGEIVDRAFSVYSQTMSTGSATAPSHLKRPVTGELHPGVVEEEVEQGEDYQKWQSVLFKMPSRRDLERWYNILRDNPQSEEWRGFVNGHTRADAFNLVIARLFFANTGTSRLRDLLVEKIRRKLRKASAKLPKNIDGSITLEHLDLGGQVPLIDVVSDPIVSPNGEIELDFNLSYRGGLMLGLRFGMKVHAVRTPDIIFNIGLLQLSNRMRLSVGPPPSKKVWLGGSRTPHLQLDFSQEVATNDGLLHTFLKILPDLSLIVSNVVKVKLFEDMVLPSMEDFPLFSVRDSPPSSELSDGEVDVDMGPTLSSTVPSTQVRSSR
ncbi:hypothetical protein ERJ75_001765200 [Trypanosoma vivax]|uniref:SMP-LTD domain-containing protein n=1 Tax=Trypanosoma vivax (strain Y486) TaxID=1055687 RepID=G0TRI2_TRYVY|nr:hypothetical protein TRVL_02501 [Trypanosoma vivax]KAH8603960.1 hypothetical protein ERJ75_001765200 [Trypanosoma vivax]CCC46546.1 conserved hypothetical protein [Trypanosoma vivax Y486]